MPDNGGRRAARRASIGILDQLVYNGSNFVLTILVARSTTTSEFGAFALLFTTWTICNSTCRGFTSETFVVRYSTADRDDWRWGASRCAGASVLLGAALGIVLIGVSFFIPGHLAHAALVMGIVFPGMFLQDFLRFAALAGARPLVALASDVTVAIVEIAGVIALVQFNSDTVATLLGAWGVAGCVGALVAAGLLRIAPWVDQGWSWLRDERDLANKYALDDLAANGGQQAPAYVVAGVSGLSGVASLRGAQSVFGPPSIFNLGINAAVTPELVRLLRRSTRQLLRAVLLVAFGSALVGALWGIAAQLAPESLGHALYGDTWDVARPLLIFFTINQAASGIRVGATAGLRSLGAANRTLLARLVAICVVVVLAPAGAIIDGPRGAAIGIMLSTIIAAITYWWHFQLGLRDHRRAQNWQQMQATWDDLVADMTDLDGVHLRPWDTTAVAAGPAGRGGRDPTQAASGRRTRRSRHRRDD